MSTTDTDASAAASEGHVEDEEHTHGHHAELDEEPLGEIDRPAWGAALLGAVVGGLVVIALFAATQG